MIPVSVLPSAKLFLPNTNRRLACQPVGKATLYSFAVKYCSRGATVLCSYLSLTNSFSTHHSTLFPWAPGLKTSHRVPTSSCTFAAGSGQEAAASLPAKTSGMQTGARLGTENRLTKGLNTSRSTDIACHSLASRP